PTGHSHSGVQSEASRKPANCPAASFNDLTALAGDAESGPSGPLTTGMNMSESFAELFEESLKSLDMQ
ncbi:hypothetical protein, partial [Klebsiella pneumoniae]|uniref:hypothetical protein n=1 Tax=Klebsiella pneumoniae TaxID=573 RepID=UPI00272FDAE0